MAEGHVCGKYHAWMGGVWGSTPPENFWNLNPGNVISCILTSKFAPKFMLTILVFEINKGRNAQKVKKKLTIIYHYLKNSLIIHEENTKEMNV
jgi:hypothetical protein